MVKHDDFSAKLQVFGDIDLSMTEKEPIFKFPFSTTNYLLSFGLEIFGQLGNIVVIVFCFSNVFEDILFFTIDENMALGNATILEHFGRENYKVLIVVLSVVKVVHVRESVRGVGGAREILKGKPKVLEDLDSSGLTTGEFLRGFPVLKVFVVGTYLNLVRGSFKVVTPFFKSANNG